MHERSERRSHAPGGRWYLLHGQRLVVPLGKSRSEYKLMDGVFGGSSLSAHGD